MIPEGQTPRTDGREKGGERVSPNQSQMLFPYLLPPRPAPYCTGVGLCCLYQQGHQCMHSSQHGWVMMQKQAQFSRLQTGQGAHDLRAGHLCPSSLIGTQPLHSFLPCPRSRPCCNGRAEWLQRAQNMNAGQERLPAPGFPKTKVSFSLMLHVHLQSALLRVTPSQPPRWRTHRLPGRGRRYMVLTSAPSRQARLTTAHRSLAKSSPIPDLVSRGREAQSSHVPAGREPEIDSGRHL